jgi:hypothetical protein
MTLIELRPYLCGFLVAALPATLTILALLSDLRRARRRLSGIIEFAKLQGYAWANRRMTGQDWADLYDAISVYEEV